MMAQDFDNTNTAALFANEEKDPKDPKHDKWSDRKGSATVKCEHCGATTEYWLNGWLKEAKATGKKFLSLTFKVKESRASRDATKDRPRDRDDGRDSRDSGRDRDDRGRDDRDGRGSSRGRNDDIPF